MDWNEDESEDFDWPDDYEWRSQEYYDALEEERQAEKEEQYRKREEHIMEYEMDWDRFTWHDTGANYDEDSEDNFYWTDTD